MKGLLALAGVLLCFGAVAAERSRIDLNGTWEFRLDPLEQGQGDGWSRGETPFQESIEVPGSWQAQGVGRPEGILRHHFAGTAWYRKAVAIPAQWERGFVQLHIGGAHRRTRLFVNGISIGEEYDGFSAPFAFDVTAAIRPGRENVFVLRIDNSGPVVEKGPREQKAELPVGMFNYITNWGGIYGDVKLVASARLRIERVLVLSDVTSKVVRFLVDIVNLDSKSYAARIRASVPGNVSAEASLPMAPGESTTQELRVHMPDAQLWSPDHPQLYTATLSILDDGGEIDRVEQRFGLREISPQGNRMFLNGKPLYLRGYGDDNIEVLGGFPPSSRETYLQRLRMAKSFGFNAMRFHSMTPPASFFEAADEVGMLVMAELPVAYTQYFLPHRSFLRRELKAVLLAYRNHPSLFSLALGNEFNLGWLHSDEEREEFLKSVAEFYAVAKELAPATLIMSNDGFIMKPTDLASIPRGFSEELPIVRHEFGGYYCSLPDISLIDRFTGAIRPTWLEAKKEWVQESGISERYAVYLRNSHRLQQLGRKFQIERVRRDPMVSGYHYWLIVDFPGGTGEGDSWEEGWFDYFWQPKNIQPAEGRTINSPVLLMLDTDVSNRTLWNDARKTVEIIISNFGDVPIRDGILRWRIEASGESLGGAETRGITVPLGEVKSLGKITVGPLGGREAREIALVAELVLGSRAWKNSWNFWCFPRDGLATETALPVISRIRRLALKRLYPFLDVEGDPVPGALLITPSFDRNASSFLRSGGRVWVLGGRRQFPGSGEGSFFPESGGAYGTIIENHPALSGFPHDGFCDLQFFNLLEGARNFSLDRWSPRIQPILGAVRTRSSFLSERKDLSTIGYILEARAGDGRLLVTTLRLEEVLDEAYPEAVFLFDRLLRYASGPQFSPSVEISKDQLQRMER